MFIARRLGGVHGRWAQHGARGMCAGANNLESLLVEKKQTSVSMQTLMKTGYGELLDQDAELRVSAATGADKRELVLIQISNFLHREMPVRWARQARALKTLPHNLGDSPSIGKVQRWYADAYHTISETSPPRSAAEAEAFEQLLSRLYTGGKDTLTNMARGLFEWKQTHGKGLQLSELQTIHDFLDKFFLSRIGSRVLIGQYLKLHKQQPSAGDDVIGLIRVDTSPLKVALQAAETARFMCMRHYGVAPNVDIMGKTDLTFAYIPAHLYYILFELLKNSMRATVEKSMEDGEMELPDIKVIISDGEGNEDVVVKVSDEGGGIRRSDMPKIFSYSFTTVDDEASQERFKSEYFSKESPLAGFGFGLPIARTYARYFGGELQVIPMEGYGTDAYVHLSRITNNKEPLP